MAILKHINAGDLSIAYEESGNADGTPVMLMHGFPYDIRTYDEVVKFLSAENCRIIVPYLRGYGQTKFLSTDTIRSGQQAALAYDLKALMDALSIEKAIVGGYDWGGRACCIVSALFSERIIGLVSMAGYNIQNIAKFSEPDFPEIEMLNWYQFYFHSERGRIGLTKFRKELCRLLWHNWSPTWKFDDDTFDASAVSFNNPDFVDVVIHSYRHRYGLVKGDPKFDAIEQSLQEQPTIKVPAIILDAEDDGVEPFSGTGKDANFFEGGYERRIIKGVGHNLPQEAPADFAKAILTFVRR
ncbi:alpha/beta fold hydrolase [Runella aurantiaca]|uniref:Alpha/beta hydrolase n=1 Tax=Runella aurantiaca TaxID=2282308 RepID=A0A369I6N4_9BACT|nr:alpha/beta hydrolase [Runella aurantiaca]RDB03895.1 alpha/beta hydrolase [Runella aurantiaca]